MSAEVGVCEHQNSNYLRMMSERDALRAEVERLRGVERGWQHDRAEWERERDEARRQVADLRAGVEAAVTALNREFYRRPATWIERLAADLRALLAGSGEQPGEVYGPRPAACCGKCPPIEGGGYDCTCEGNPRCVRERVAMLVRLSRIADRAWEARRSDAGFQEDVERLTDAVLAVVGPSVTAEAVRARLYTPEGQVRQEVQGEVEAAIRRYPNMDAPSWLGGVAAVQAVYRAVVRPSGQEGSR